ncbi:MAG: hypothetical protein CMJ49_06095 [Planctomycetaceae bacterium]|nr:hypothetical protein [Planctomycetaceae bacterium]
MCLPEWEGQSRRWCVWIDDADELGEEHLRQFWLTHGNGECTPIHDTAQYYWPVNEVVIERPAVDGFAGGTLGMGFETFTPWFDGFEVSADGGPWTAHAAAHVEGHRAEGEVAWALHPGRNVLEIRSRNTSGRVGPTALIEIASLSHVPPEGDGHWHVGGDVADPGGMAVRGGRLYAARPWSGRVDVLLDGEVVAEIGTAVPVPGHPLGPPIEPLHEAANIRRAADAPRGHLMSPMACVVGTDGTVFVADSENYRVQPFDADGRALDPWGEHGVEDGQFLHIRALAAGDDGSVYVADSGYCGAVGLRTEHLSRVRRFDADGTLVGLIARGESTDGDVRSPAGLAVDTAGMLWVADSGHHRVLCFANDGRRQQCWGQFGDGWGDLRYPTDVAVTDDGIVFVADPQHHCVWKFTATGKVLCQITRGDDGLPLLRPGRLTSDGKELFVGDVHSGLVHRYRDVTG